MASSLQGFDSAATNATMAVSNASEAVAKKMTQMDDLIKQLEDPKANTAAVQARLQKLNMEISMITNVMNSIKDLMKAFFQR
ncbi:MAG TPA: hypothetical protein V6D00_07645 [Pantanalinema sp.]|nr:hypothetical protein [bacterium]